MLGVCQGMCMGGHDCSEFEMFPKMSGLITSEMFICCWSYRLWYRLKLFPIFTFPLLQIPSLFTSHEKWFCSEEDGSIYLYICLYEYNIQCFIVSHSRIKWLTLKAETKHYSDLVKIGCFVRIERKYVGKPCGKSKQPLRLFADGGVDLSWGFSVLCNFCLKYSFWPCALKIIRK